MLGIEQEIGDLLRAKRLTLGTVESATGGLIAHRITNVAGSSDYFSGGIITYSNGIKTSLAGVPEDLLQKHGAVSAPVAAAMAAGGRKTLGVDICVSVTGIAGPGGATARKPVGLFFVGLAHGDFLESRKVQFSGSREANKTQASDTTLQWLLSFLRELKS
ncbi:MAG: CinA family protein [Chloroflexota bacterium]